MTQDFLYTPSNTNDTVCSHPLGSPGPSWWSGKTSSMKANSNVLLGNVKLRTIDKYVTNNFPIGAQVTSTMDGQGVTTQQNNTPGIFDVRFQVSTSGTYKIDLFYSDIKNNNSKITTDGPITITVLPDTAMQIITNKTDPTICKQSTTGTNNFICNDYTCGDTPILYFTGKDQYDNQLTYDPSTITNLSATLQITDNNNNTKNYPISINKYDTIGTYSVTENYNIAGKYVITIMASQQIIYSYTKRPGNPSSVNSYATYISLENMLKGQTASVTVTLIDQWGNNLLQDDKTKSKSNNIKVIATSTNNDILNFSFDGFDSLDAKLSVNLIEDTVATRYDLRVYYDDGTNPRTNINFSKSNNFFNVDDDTFDIFNCKLSAIISNTIEMSQNSILQIKQDDMPLFKYSFYNLNGDKVQSVDNKIDIQAIMIPISSTTSKITFNMQWIGNEILWTFPSDTSLTTGLFNIQIIYLSAFDQPSQTYHIQIFDNNSKLYTDDSNANFDPLKTFFKATEIRAVAGEYSTFSIECRIPDNLRYTNCDIKLLSVVNNKNLNTDQLKVYKQSGTKNGEILITVSSRIVSTSSDPIILSFFYNKIPLIQTVNVIIKHAELNTVTILNPQNPKGSPS